MEISNIFVFFALPLCSV